MRMKIIERLKDEKFLLKIMAIITAAIIFIPTLYSFTFLGAFWDPYARLNKISSIAFVNLDKPIYKNGKKYNVGQQLEDKLKDNTDFKWEFVNYNTAKNGVENTSYYAMIVVPKDFSKKISNSIVDGNFKKPDLIYEGNAGRNYIFSLLTKRGAETIESQVEQSITKETSKALIDNLYDVKKSTKTAADSSKQLADGSNKLLNGSNQILDGITNKNTGADGMPLGLQNGSEQISTGLYDAKTGILSAQGAVSQIEPKLNSYKDLLGLLTVQNMDSLKTMAIDANDLNNSTSNIDLLGFSKTLNSINPSDITAVTNTVNTFNSMDLSDLSQIDFGKLNNFKTDIQNAYPMIESLSSDYGKLQQMASSVQGINVQQLRTQLETISNDSQALSAVINNVDPESMNSLNQFLNNQNDMMALSDLLNNTKTFSGTNGTDLINFLSTEKSVQNSMASGYQGINQILSSGETPEQKIADIQSKVMIPYSTQMQQLSSAGLTPDKMNQTTDSMINTVKTINTDSNTIASSGIQNTLSPNNIALLKALTSPDAQTKMVQLKAALASNDMSTAITQANSMLDQVDAAQHALKDPNIQKAEASIATLQNDLNDNQGNLAAINSLVAKNGLDTAKIVQLQNDTKASAGMINSIGALLNDPNVQSQLKNAPETLDKLSKLKSEVNDNQKLLGVAKDYLNDGNIAMANNLIAQVPSMVDKFNELSSGIVKLSDGSSRLNSGINTLADGSTQLNNGISKLNDGNNKFNDALNSSYKNLNKNLKFSSSKFSKFLSAPINLKDNSINPVKNYGEGLAPYFVALSAWLGALFINAIIIILEMLDLFKKRFNNSPIVEYTLGIILVSLQALMFTLFLRVGLGLTTSVNPAGLYLNNIFIACIYYSVMFGLTQAFGIGSIPASFVLLIIQLSSCAGTFPIETAYPFYRIVGKFIPMTYTVNTLRMVISGINTKVYMQNFNILIIFAVVTLACGTLIGYLRKYFKAKHINKNNDSTTA